MKTLIATTTILATIALAGPVLAYDGECRLPTPGTVETPQRAKDRVTRHKGHIVGEKKVLYARTECLMTGGTGQGDYWIPVKRVKFLD